MIYSSVLNLENSVKETSGEWKVTSPSNSEQALGTCVYRYSDIEVAIQGATRNQALLSFQARRTVIAKAHAALLEQKQKILETAKNELGRNETELELEWDTLSRYLIAMAADATLDLDETSPRGLSVVLGSYAWPIFYSVQFALANFLAGNSVILKPSEKATLTVLSVVETLRTIAELKVIQLVVGEREVGRRLATHEAVATIIFQGSFEVGMRVKQDALSMPAKEVLLYLGAKNPSIIFNDALPGIEETLLQDAFLGAGQHCRSVSVVFVEQGRLASFTDRFHELSKAFKIGSPETHPFMGPLIDGAMLDRYLKFIGISEREGAKVEMRGKPLQKTEKGHFITPTIALFENVTVDQLRKSVSLQTEILSPHVSIIGFQDEESLMGLLDAMTHGKLASIWTRDLEKANRLAKRIAAGEIAINNSGNHARLGQGLLSQLVFSKQISD
jgi:succinylglutamic semialdehyde dehydrogenase